MSSPVASFRVRAVTALLALTALVAGCGDTTTTLPAAQIVTALHDRGVPLESVVAFTPATDPDHVLGTTGGPVSRAGWHDPRAPGGDAVNAVEVFRSVQDAQRRVADLSSRRTVAQFSFIEANVVLRLSHDLTQGQALEYDAALKAVLGL